MTFKIFYEEELRNIYDITDVSKRDFGWIKCPLGNILKGGERVLQRNNILQVWFV